MNNYGIRESLEATEGFLRNDVMNVVRLVTMEQLIMASENEEIHRALESADLAVIEDKSVLAEAGITSVYRINELKVGAFFEDFMLRTSRSGYSIYLIGPDKNKVSIFRSRIEEKYKHIKLLGEGVIGDDISKNENTLNDINVLLPDIVISILESPDQDVFINNYKDRIYAKLWVGLGADDPEAQNRSVVGNLIRNVIGGMLFRRHSGKLAARTGNDNNDEREM